VVERGGARTPLPILRRSLAESWRSLVGWTIGVAAALLLYLPLYPSLGGNGQLQEILDQLPRELVKTIGYDQIGTGAGYAQATFYGLIGFVILLIAAISWGGAAIAGAEESGRLELALAHAVGRLQYALESALSILVRLAWLGLFAAVVVLALNEPAELDLDWTDVLAVTAALVGLTLLSGALGLAVGALTGRRSLATGAGAAIAVLGYVFNAVANQSADLEGLRVVSPYAWAYHAMPLENGADWGGLALLWGISALLIAVAAIGLRQRDVKG
jgi:ABC-2 type transport system permease protein